jgi:hypothetical protein
MLAAPARAYCLLAIWTQLRNSAESYHPAALLPPVDHHSKRVAAVAGRGDRALHGLALACR